MSIHTDLKKEGIEIVKQLDTARVNSIASTVSEKLVKAFPEQNIKQQELFMKLSRLNMYIASMPEGTASAKYYYKNSSIYFNEKIDLDKIDIYAVHECIHYLQELKDLNGNMIQLGLCDFSNSKLPGMALNEAAVQLMSAITMQNEEDTVMYYDISFSTISPSNYALECNLLKQMAYITGDYALFNSTLYSNNSFKNKFISLTDNKSYSIIEKDMDKLLMLEDDLSSVLIKKESSDEQIDKLNKQAKTIRENIKKTYFKIQNKILTSYFDSNFKTIYTLEQIDNYRRKLYNFQELIGTEKNYKFFNNYYEKKMLELERKHHEIENRVYENEDQNALVPIKESLFAKLIKKIKHLLGKKDYEENYE